MGELTKPNKQGFYKCPYCPPPTNGYPARKWKTEKGILKHLSECNYTPEKVLLREKKDKESKEIFKSFIPKALELFGMNIGDEIHYVKKTVIKPEYEWRGERRVKVRYESVLKFEACGCVISKIDFTYSSFAMTLNEVLHNCLLINNTIRLNQICADKSSAELRAEKLQENHDAHLKFSSECR